MNNALIPATSFFMDNDQDLAKLRWRCRRGMRELDAVLIAFLEQSFGALTKNEKERFAELLELPDPELYGYLIRRNEPHDAELARLVERIRQSARPSA